MKEKKKDISRMKKSILELIPVWALALGLLPVLVFTLTGCHGAVQESKKTDMERQENGMEQKDETIEFSIEDYQKKLADNRAGISVCRSQYPNETEVLSETEYPNISFQNCEFRDFPEAEKLEVFVNQLHGISVQESWDTIENWLEDIGKQDVIDMKTDVRVVSPKLGLDEDGEYFLFYDHMSELDSGEGAFINEKECHIQIAANGIYSMSNGKMTEYLASLGYESRAVGDALGNHSEDVIQTGSLSELGDKKFELISGEVTLAEGAELVKSYFEAGTPFPCAEGVTLDIPEVRVFRLGEVYGYDYILRRVYHSVPFAYFQYGSRNDYDGYCQISEDNLHAYVVDESGTAAACGTNPCEELVTLLSEDQMIGLEQMAELLSENLAPQLNIQVKSVELVYTPVDIDEAGEYKVGLPCWQLIGDTKTSGEAIVIYVDVLTGEIYYYTSTPSGQKSKFGCLFFDIASLKE